jgi:dipeptidyl aminopeptidase/acylaminoacyl peptidase
MSAVDHAVAAGWADPDALFVTGGSGGGILTAWIVTHTDRFRAAVAQKPVINWYSMTFTTDIATLMYPYWFASPPWEAPEEYLRRSPVHHVQRAKTPTMLLTGEQDYRTPMSESEQFYQALKLNRVDTALVRIPEAAHGISARPSHLISKVKHVLAWFERYRDG